MPQLICEGACNGNAALALDGLVVEARLKMMQIGLGGVLDNLLLLEALKKLKHTSHSPADLPNQFRCNACGAVRRFGGMPLLT